jgi:membrane protein DedA with SNARE-associated domain
VEETDDDDDACSLVRLLGSGPGAGLTRRTVFWLVVGLTATILLAVVGTILFSLLDQQGALGLVTDLEDDVAAYLAVFGLVFADAIVPIFPGETTLTTASVAASQGELELVLVVVAGAIGAILGDSALYWIARTGPRTLKSRLEAAGQRDKRVASGLALLGRSAPLLIACGRFVPGVRFAVNVSMGLTEYPYRRFLLFSAIGGSAWAVYTCALAYWISTALADFPVASIVISGVVTTVFVAAVYWMDRRRHASDVPDVTVGDAPITGQGA